MKSMARRTISTKQTDEEESNVAALGISRWSYLASSSSFSSGFNKFIYLFE
jgi:hypothetical protein